jgi:quercetin dioxygenase-like cupin family protein
LKGGEVLVLPGNVAHSCTALEDSHILDLFSPVSATTGVDRH